MLVGVNVDPTNKPPAVADLVRIGVKAVRLVSRPDDQTYRYVETCHQGGLRVLAVVAQESKGYITPHADVYQIGNEPDVVGASSWTMEPDKFVEMWGVYRGTYPDFTMIGPGLAAGEPSWWQSVGPRISGCAGVAIHPYNKTADQAQQLLWDYHVVRPDIALWVTEWNRPTDQIVTFNHMLQAMADGAFYFCASDKMVNGMGLLDKADHLKPEGQMWSVSV